MPAPEHRVIEQFEYRGFGGRCSWCRLEVIPLGDGRTVIIASQLPGNPGTPMTNAAEHLASHVCDRFGINPDRLVWNENYGHGGPRGTASRKQEYDLATVRLRPIDSIRWSDAVPRHKPSGWPGDFEEPQWRTMTAEDWRELGLGHS